MTWTGPNGRLMQKSSWTVKGKNEQGRKRVAGRERKRGTEGMQAFHSVISLQHCKHAQQSASDRWPSKDGHAPRGQVSSQRGQQHRGG